MQHDLQQETKNQYGKKSFKLARLPRVLDIVGNSRSWIYQEVAGGRFPKPISIGKRNVAWIEQEIFDWIEQRIKANRTPGGKSHV